MERFPAVHAHSARFGASPGSIYFGVRDLSQSATSEGLHRVGLEGPPEQLLSIDDPAGLDVAADAVWLVASGHPSAGIPARLVRMDLASEATTTWFSGASSWLSVGFVPPELFNPWCVGECPGQLDADIDGPSFLEGPGGLKLAGGAGLIAVRREDGAGGLLAFDTQAPGVALVLSAESQGVNRPVDVFTSQYDIFMANQGVAGVGSIRQWGPGFGTIATALWSTSEPIVPLGTELDPCTGELIVADGIGNRLIAVAKTTGTIRTIATSIGVAPIGPDRGFASVDVSTDGGGLLLTLPNEIVYFRAVGPDCNNNGRRDVCDIVLGGSSDPDGNGVPSECE